MRVLNFGSLNIDYVYQVDRFVQPGETMSALSLAVNCGGKGLNQSVALARAGAETWHAGLIGAEGAQRVFCEGTFQLPDASEFREDALQVFG